MKTSKIPYRQALQEKGYVNYEPDFLDLLANLGVSGYSAQLEGIDPIVLNTIPTNTAIALPETSTLTDPIAGNSSNSSSDPSNNDNSIITIDAAVEILEADGIPASPEDVTNIVEILGYKTSFPKSELPQVASLMCWAYATQMQEAIVSEERGLAEEGQEALRQDAAIQGSVDAFLQEISYSEAYLETRRTLTRERTKALKATQKKATPQLFEALSRGEERLKEKKQAWIDSSEQQQSQQAKNREALEKFLKKRSS